MIIWLCITVGALEFKQRNKHISQNIKGQQGPSYSMGFSFVCFSKTNFFFLSKAVTFNMLKILLLLNWKVTGVGSSS